MRIPAAFCIVLSVACCAAPVPQRPADPAGSTPPAGNVKPAAFRVLASGQYGLAAQTDDPAALGRMAPFIEVATGMEEFEEKWEQHIGGERSVAPAAGETAIFLLLPPYPTGGYSVTPREVSVEGTTVTVHADINDPPKGAMTTQAWTAPWVIVAVPGRVERVDWMSHGSLIRDWRAE